MGNMCHKLNKLSGSRRRATGRGSGLSRVPQRSSSLSLSLINRRESMNTTSGMPSSISSEVDKKKKYELIADDYTSIEQNTTGGMPSSISSEVDKKKKYELIADDYTSIEQLKEDKLQPAKVRKVTTALKDGGLKSSNLIIGIDFTKSNEWTGKVSFNNRSLHAIGDTPNSYEEAISIIGKTLDPSDEDNKIPCFGFGDATTNNEKVFSFHDDKSPGHGFKEVLDCYKKIVPTLRLYGPTSYAPVVDVAVDIVEKSGGRYHVLVIIADGQVSPSLKLS